jgi:hypothetical protein
VKIAKKSDRKKLEELKKKIHKKEYLDYAIAKIAQTLANDLVNEECDGQQG